MSGTLEVLIIGLAAFRLASLFVREEGPFDAFGRLRRLVGVPEGPGAIPEGLGTLLSCIWCTGLWTAALAWVIWQVAPALDAVLAAAAVVMIADRHVNS